MVDAVKLLHRLSDAFGPPGGEEPVAQLVMEYLAPCCQLSRDGLGSVMAEKPGRQERPRLMLAAHMDEVGFMVQNITPQGYLCLQALGSWVPSLVPGQRLMIQGSKGLVEGVVATIPPHFVRNDQKEVKIEDLYLDIGAGSAQDVRGLGINLGHLIVPKSGFAVLNQAYFLNKAWDDRVGVAAMVAALLQLKELPHPNTVLAVATVQEEVGSRGAAAAVELIRPDLAIVLEGTPADDYPGLTADSPQGALGHGCQIRLFDPSIIVPRCFAEWIVAVAEQHQIPYQLAVRRGGATDARVLHLAHGGIPTLILGVPVRYAHSPAGIIYRGDFEALVALLVALIQELTPEIAQGLRFKTSARKAGP
ncbi:MAG: M42 family metallopeptidase [Deltaproteobacteria bacterium]|nr:M42 family metallopeptidase [Deltaproteobacteria bacterium]